MKKFLVAVLVIAMVSMMGLVALAYDVAPNGDKWIESATLNDDGSVTFALSQSEFVGSHGAGGYRFAVFDAKPSVVVEGDEGFWTHFDGKGAIYYLDSANGASQTAPADKFELGKTYWVTLVGLDAAGVWRWSDKPFSFVYGEQGGSDEPTTTADVSTIAFAVASVLGCGALVVRKKR